MIPTERDYKKLHRAIEKVAKCDVRRLRKYASRFTALDVTDEEKRLLMKLDQLGLFLRTFSTFQFMPQGDRDNTTRNLHIGGKNSLGLHIIIRTIRYPDIDTYSVIAECIPDIESIGDWIEIEPLPFFSRKVRDEGEMIGPLTVDGKGIELLARKVIAIDKHG